MAQNMCTMNVTSFDLNKAITFNKFFSKVKLSASARLVLRCLIDFWNPSKGLVYPGQNMIAECTGVTRRSVVAAIEELRLQNLLLTEGESGRKLKYFFTSKFFECAEISQHSEKISQVSGEKISQHEQKKHEQSKNNKVVSLNSKMPYRHDTHIKGMSYPDLKPQEHVRDERTPENDLETAKKFVEELMPMAQNPVIKVRLEKIFKIWGHEKFEQVKEPVKNLHKPDQVDNVGEMVKINYSSQF